MLGDERYQKVQKGGWAGCPPWEDVESEISVRSERESVCVTFSQIKYYIVVKDRGETR